MEIEILRDENVRLKAIVTKLELKDVDRSRTLLQEEVERKALRRTVRSQEAQLSALEAAQAQLEIKDQIINSQAELIETITTAAQILPALLAL
ncbi:hypothetical protein LZ554_006135 [Drepanopeziza brunnea f. sp. 'monogermtubi']|nr:hypothetical protein LZ554_006135 [Drepanopeziza brunnea f. sp. 'monogermtubi']